MRCKGGRLHADRFIGDEKMLFEHDRAMFHTIIQNAQKRWPRMPRVHFDFVDNAEFNAVAFIVKNHEFIGMYHGMYAKLLKFFGRIFSDRGLFPEIGNPDKERSGLPLFGLPWGQLGESPFLPRDDTRVRYKQLLFAIARDFTFWHEYGHLANGHLGWLTAKQSCTMLPELSSGIQQVGDITMQALEMDADSFAVTQTLSRYLETQATQDIPDVWKVFFKTKEQVITTWATAVYSFFCLMGDRRFDVDSLNSSHPPPAIRQNIALATAATLFLTEKLEVDYNSICAPILSVEQAIAHITNRKVDLRPLEMTLERMAVAHRERIHARWKTLRPELEPFARTKLAD